MIRRVLLVAILAGVAAGILQTAVQLTRVTPLILHAETFENANSTGIQAPYSSHDHGAAAIGDASWAPEDGLERNAFSLLASVVTAIGFGMLLAAGFALHGGPIGAGRGILWGLGGFMVFWLAPSLGLPPELPGMVAADLVSRQIWYLGTVVATGAGLALLIFRAELPAKGVGAMLLAAPHIIGAPHPEQIGGNVPPELATMFVVASLFAAIVLWTVLGSVGGYLYDRLGRTA